MAVWGGSHPVHSQHLLVAALLLEPSPWEQSLQHQAWGKLTFAALPAVSTRQFAAKKGWVGA